MEWFKFYHNKWLTDPAIVSLKPIDRLIFITLLCLASQSDERDGTVRYVSNEALRCVTLGHNAYKLGEAFDGVEALEKMGLVTLISANSLKICNFEKRQNTALTNAERQKLYRERYKVVTYSNERYNDSNARVDKIRVDKITTTTAESDGFNSFWNNYPRKIGKSAAEKAWQKYKPPLSVVLEAIEKQKNSDQWSKDNGQFIPHPTTWLNGKRWEDEVTDDKVKTIIL
jgi:hypothetical protein